VPPTTANPALLMSFEETERDLAANVASLGFDVPGDLRPDQVKQIATRLGVTEQDVVEMNRRLGGDAAYDGCRSEGAGTPGRALMAKLDRAV
jgi:hypothetical protein